MHGAVIIHFDVQYYKCTFCNRTSTVVVQKKIRGKSRKARKTKPTARTQTALVISEEEKANKWGTISSKIRDMLKVDDFFVWDFRYYA